MLRSEWLVQYDRFGRLIEVGAQARIVSEDVAGIVRSIGTKAWLDVDGRRRGVGFDEIEMLPEMDALRRFERGRPAEFVSPLSQTYLCGQPPAATSAAPAFEREAPQEVRTSLPVPAPGEPAPQRRRLRAHLHNPWTWPTPLRTLLVIGSPVMLPLWFALIALTAIGALSAAVVSAVYRFCTEPPRRRRRYRGYRGYS